MTTTPVDSIPVAKTPTGGYGDSMPPPILAGCDDALVDSAPDLRGLWQIISVSVEGVDDPAHFMIGSTQRIEQAGDRLIVTSGGVIHDMRCDGTLENGVHDVAAADFTTPVNVTATFADGVHVLRPDGLPIEVKRWRDGDDLMWQYVGFTARLTRLDATDRSGAPQ